MKKNLPGVCLWGKNFLIASSLTRHFWWTKNFFSKTWNNTKSKWVRNLLICMLSTSIIPGLSVRAFGYHNLSSLFRSRILLIFGSRLWWGLCLCIFPRLVSWLERPRKLLQFYATYSMFCFCLRINIIFNFIEIIKLSRRVVW